MAAELWKQLNQLLYIISIFQPPFFRHHEDPYDFLYKFKFLIKPNRFSSKSSLNKRTRTIQSFHFQLFSFITVIVVYTRLIPAFSEIPGPQFRFIRPFSPFLGHFFGYPPRWEKYKNKRMMKIKNKMHILSFSAIVHSGTITAFSCAS